MGTNVAPILANIRMPMLENELRKKCTNELLIVDTVKDGNNGLRADWGVRSFREPQKQALFDVCILNADSHICLYKIIQRKNKKISTCSKAANARHVTKINTCSIADKKFSQYKFNQKISELKEEISLAQV